MEQLEANLQQYKAINPALPVVIKGDSAVQYVKVVNILALLGKLDITQIGLVTQTIKD
jgi:biopolymer transport protein ExbD